MQEVDSITDSIDKILQNQNKKQNDIILLFKLMAENNNFVNELFYIFDKKISLIEDYIWLCKMKHKELNTNDLFKCNATLINNIYNHFSGWKNFKNCVNIYKKENINGKAKQ